MLFHCVLTFTFVQWPSVCWTFLHSLLKRTFKAIEHWQLLLYISMQYSTQPVPSMYEIVEPPLTHLINTSMDIFTNLCNRLISKTDCLCFLLLNFLILPMYICEAYNFCCRGTIWLWPLSSLLFHEPFVQASTPHLMFHRSVSFHLNYLLIAEDMLHRFENGPQNPGGN